MARAGSIVQARGVRRLSEREVFEVAFGAMNLSIEGRPPRERALATLRAAADAGMDVIDTADVYGLDEHDALHNLRLVAEADTGALVSTKVGVRREGDAWLHDGDPRYLRRAAEASLRALGADTIELLHLHAVDDRVPIEESVGALARLREEGKARRLGVSNVDADQLARALGETELASVQNEVSPFVAPDPEVLAICEDRSIALLGYAPMGGWRAGRIAHEPLLRDLAARYEATPHEVVIAALLARSPALILVCGASRPENARSSARAARLALRPEDQRAFEARYWS